ncbi:uncharacterized protein [Chelonus insularis]|uniref:uncharacterized protein n=1 Tax=Chelonus insularis TaxID=460826 RepID=UPI00158CF686|nr:uncharacterized protein LOC118066514 [Chelonus insularis]
MIRIIIVLILITFTTAYPHESISNQHQNEKKMAEVIMNDSFDKNLPSIREFILSNGMDPMAMPDYTFPITFPFGVGKVHLQKGWVQDMVTIRRTGDVILRYNIFTMKFDFDLGWENVDVAYDYTIRFLGYLRKGLFHGRFHNLKVKIVGSMDLKTHQLKLDLLKFMDVEDFTLKLEGHLTDHLINVMSRILTAFAKERVLREVEYQSTKIITEKIREINESKLNSIFENNFTSDVREVVKNNL